MCNIRNINRQYAPVWGVTSRWWAIAYRHFLSSRIDRFYRPLKMRVLRLLRNVRVSIPYRASVISQNGILTTTTAETSGGRSTSFCVFRRCEGKIHPVSGREDTEGDWGYGFSLCLTSALGEGWSTPRFGRFTPEKESVPIVQEAGWAPMQVWTAAENLVLTEFRSPDRLARRESLYQQSHPGPRSPICVVCVTND
jgi:hypothetical protein